MAKTRFETKKGMPLWAILAALIVLALLVWAISSLRNRGHRQVIEPVALATPAPVFVPSVRYA